MSLGIDPVSLDALCRQPRPAHERLPAHGCCGSCSPAQSWPPAPSPSWPPHPGPNRSLVCPPSPARWPSSPSCSSRCSTCSTSATTDAACSAARHPRKPLGLRRHRSRHRPPRPHRRNGRPARVPHHHRPHRSVRGHRLDRAGGRRTHQDRAPCASPAGRRMSLGDRPAVGITDGPDRPTPGRSKSNRVYWTPRQGQDQLRNQVRRGWLDCIRAERFQTELIKSASGVARSLP